MDKRMHFLLASLPLLQGVSAADVAQILDHVGYELWKTTAGKRIILQGDTCHYLTFLVEGNLQADCRSADDRYTFTETLQAPLVVEPDVLYGIQRQYACTYTTTSDCVVLTLPKNDVNQMLATIEVFRLNYLNLLSTLAIRRREATQPQEGASLRSRLIRFLANHASQPSGHKRFAIRMSDIGDYLGVSRVLISDALHELADEQLLSIGRGGIEIPALERLVTHRTR